MDKQYVCVSEFGREAVVGTLFEIEEWMSSENINYLHCTFYELGGEVEVSLTARDK